MAYKVVWTKQAEDDFDNIVSYLEAKWTEREIRKFISETERVVSILKKILFCIEVQTK